MNYCRLLCICLFCSICCKAQDTTYIQVKFLYGSKPARGYHNEEARWFGGILGGHVGIGMDSNQVISFNRMVSFTGLRIRIPGIASSRQKRIQVFGQLLEVTATA